MAYARGDPVSPVWIAFVCGVFVGTFAGVFALALMVAARDADEAKERGANG